MRIISLYESSNATSARLKVLYSSSISSPMTFCLFPPFYVVHLRIHFVTSLLFHHKLFFHPKFISSFPPQDDYLQIALSCIRSIYYVSSHLPTSVSTCKDPPPSSLTYSHFFSTVPRSGCFRESRLAALNFSRYPVAISVLVVPHWRTATFSGICDFLFRSFFLSTHLQSAHV